MKQRLRRVAKTKKGKKVDNGLVQYVEKMLGVIHLNVGSAIDGFTSGEVVSQEIFFNKCWDFYM